MERPEASAEAGVRLIDLQRSGRGRRVALSSGSDGTKLFYRRNISTKRFRRKKLSSTGPTRKYV